jgi:RimJ/RimL family protein N-acetyltransferase
LKRSENDFDSIKPITKVVRFKCDQFLRVNNAWNMKIKKVYWKRAKPILFSNKQGTYKLRLIEDNKKEFKKVAKFYIKAYPELWHTPWERYFHPKQYPDFLDRGNKFTKEQTIIIAENLRTKEIAGAHGLVAHPELKSAEWDLIAVAPAERGKGIGIKIQEYTDMLTKKSGFDPAFAHCVADHYFSQALLKKFGFQVFGVVSGFCIYSYKDKSYKRIPGVLMEKFYNHSEELILKDIFLIKDAEPFYKENPILQKVV